MRNLTLVDHRHRAVGRWVPSGAHLCVSPMSRSAYMVHTQGIECLTEASPQLPPTAWREHVSTSRVVSAECLSDCVCVVTAEGQVVTVSTQDGEVEVVGDMEEGVSAACWSPDQELLVLVTASANVVIMAHYFEPIAEVSLSEAAAAAQPMVALGWGRKETQFHGSEGKAAAAAKPVVRPAPAWDNGRMRVSWRGDGELFAVSHFPDDSPARRIAVVTCEGVVQALSEELDALESSLAWKPAGGVLAATQTAGNKHEVVFIEKNGLKHGGFALPFPPGRMEVVELAWSPDSSVLAVWARPWRGQEAEEEAEREEEEVVQLWMSKNYHWYLKKEIKLGGGIRSLCWAEEAASPAVCLHLLTSTHYHRLACLPAHHHSSTQSPHDSASVAVVDGPSLLVTPLRHVVVPPPASAFRVKFPDAINSLAFCLADSTAEGDVDDSGFLEGCEDTGIGCNAVCVQHGPDALTLLAPTGPDQPANCDSSVEVTGTGGNGFRATVRPLGVLCQLKVEWPDHVSPRPVRTSDLYHWTWPAKGTLLAVFSTEDSCYLVFIDLQAEARRAVASKVMSVEDWVVAVAASPTLAALQLASGSLLRLDLATRSVEPFTVEGTEVRLPDACQQLCLCPVDGGAALLPLGLTSRGRLYLGHKQLLADCTSIHVHTHHLLATTLAHTLLAIPLTSPALATVGQDESGVRRVERGSRIVLAVAHDSRVVLQMPRGNLEVVNPRPLVVHALARLLATRQYGVAVELARRHRIDANLLYDHNPAEFLAAAEHFVRDVDPQHLDLFLASLTETDSSATTYAFHYPGRPVAVAKGKVLAVCEALRAAMVAVDEGRHLLPILTSLVKAGHMEAALARVGEMRRLVEEGGRVFEVGPDEGLRHLLYLADTEELYRVALGTYDLSLALMVAERSAKDPKEYLPQLNGLRQLAEPLRKFRIDVLLRRFRSALQCLGDSAEHQQEVLELVEGEGLHALALQVLPAGSALKTAVCESYGQRLLAKNLPGEAAIMFDRAGQHSAALEAYRSAGNWKMALVTATKLGPAKERLVELSHSLAAELKERGQYLEAARLYEQHLADEEEAVECLASAGEWEDALRVAHKHSRPDLVETNIRPSALCQAALARADVKDVAASLAQHTARLAVVRLAKEKQHSAVLLSAADEAQLDSDLYSDTSTVSGLDHHPSHTPSTTASSTRSQRSSKNRRKLERKKYSTKEGSPQEDLGLVSALHETYSTLTSQAETTGALCSALVTLGHDGEAAALQAEFSDLLKLAKSKKKEIWPPLVPLDQPEVEFGPEMTTEGAVQQLRGEGSARGSFVALRMGELDPHLRYPPPPPRDSWRLGLLVTKSA